MTAPKDRFWAKVLFKEYIRHYRKLNESEIVDDVKQSMDDLDDLNENGSSFGSKMVKWSIERKSQYPLASQNGSNGGRPHKNPQPSEEKETSKPAEKHVVVNKDVFGDFENVYLSQDEHNEFIKKVGNINEAAKIIDQLSAALADGKEKSTNHYATLLRWLNYRNDKKENAPKSFEEHERERSSKLVMSFLAKTGGPIDDDTGPY